jgi:hypothetical protein
MRYRSVWHSPRRVPHKGLRIIKQNSGSTCFYRLLNKITPVAAITWAGQEDIARSNATRIQRPFATRRDRVEPLHQFWGVI